MSRAAAVLIALLALLVFAPLAQAETCPKTSLPEIQDEVMCLICGVPLENAGGPSAEDQRNFIRARVEQCETKEEIKTALVAEYGSRVLAVPAKSGFDLAAYLVPIIVLLAALTAIIAGAIGWRRTRARELPDGPADGGADQAELDEDLKRYDL